MPLRVFSLTSESVSEGHPDIGFDYENCEVEIYVYSQSSDISPGVADPVSVI